jgi:hypothetical protein
MAVKDVPKLIKNRDMKRQAPLDLIRKNQDLGLEATVVAEKAIAIERTITVAKVADHHMVPTGKVVPALGKIGMPEEREDLLITIESINLVITIATEETPIDPLTITRVEIIITLIEITIEAVAIDPMKIVASVAEIIDSLLAETKAATKQIVIAEIMMAGIETIKIDTLLVTT